MSIGLIFRLVTHATEVVDSSNWKEIIPTDYTVGIEKVGADDGKLETESLPSAEQLDSQDQVAVSLIGRILADNA